MRFEIKKKEKSFVYRHFHSFIYQLLEKKNSRKKLIRPV